MFKKHGIMRRVAALMLALTLLAGMMPAAFAEADEEEKAVLYVDGRSVGRVHLRSGASLSADSLGLYNSGTPVTVEKKLANGWSKVTIGRETGYMSTCYLAKETDAVARTAVVDSDGALNLRMQPNLNAEILQKLRKGQQLVLFGKTSDGWYLVQVPATGFIGYVMASYVKVDAKPAAVTHVEQPPFSLTEWQDGKRAVSVNVDGSDYGFLAMLTRQVTWLSVDRVTWIDDITPILTPVYRAERAAQGSAYRVRVDIPDCGITVALTCCVGGVFQTWFVTQSGDTGEFLLIPPSEW